MALPPKWYQFLVSVFASLGSLLYGYDLGVIAGAVASDNFVSMFNPTKAETGAVVSVFTGGAFFGAMFAGPAGDALGRKKTILLGALIFILGGALQAGARALSYLYAGRGEAFHWHHRGETGFPSNTSVYSNCGHWCRLPGHDRASISSRTRTS